MFRYLLFLIIIFRISFSLKSKSSERNEIFTDWRIGQKASASSSRGSGAFAENIKCDKNNEEEQFSAIITLPVGFGTVPVFNEASNVNPTISDKCVIKQTVVGSNKFSLKVFDFDACGVQTQKASDGALWMSASLRFPLIGSLRTAEDEIITLMCRPMDRIIVRNHVLDIKSEVANPSRTVFSSSPLDFESNLEIYLKSNEENSFTRMLPNEDVIEVGKEVQLRATIRNGDGWKYVMLKDVTVHKVIPQTLNSNKNIQIFSSLNSLRQTTGEREPQTSNTFLSNSMSIRKPSIQRFGKSSTDRQKRQIPDAAFLVLSDGCRNPVYRTIAIDHPIQDSDDNLVVKFNFRAFMFQDMDQSGTIRITAKVVACVEEEDCRPTRCIDDDEIGYGRRRKRSLKTNESQIESFSKELNLRVVMPRFKSAFVNSEGNTVINDLFSNLDQNECRFAIYLIATIALMFCFLVTIFSSIILIKFKTIKH